MAYNYEYPYYDSNMYNDDWLLSEMKRVINEWAAYNNNWDKWQQDTNAAFADLKNYVTNYFNNLDIQSEMYNDGILQSLLTGVFVKSEEDFEKENTAFTLINDIVITKPITAFKQNVYINLNGYTIKLSDDYSYDYIFSYDDNTTELSRGQKKLYNGMIDMNNKDSYVIKSGTSWRTIITDLIVINCIRGFWGYINNGGGAECYISKLTLYHSDNYDNNYGLTVMFGDSVINDVLCIFFKGGILNSRGSSNFYNNCHVWGYPKTTNNNYSDNLIMNHGFVCVTNGNRFVGCYADTIEPINITADASYSNGGIGFISLSSNISFIDCYASTHNETNNSNHIGFYLYDTSPITGLSNYEYDCKIVNCFVTTSKGKYSNITPYVDEKKNSNIINSFMNSETTFIQCLGIGLSAKYEMKEKYIIPYIDNNQNSLLTINGKYIGIIPPYYNFIFTSENDMLNTFKTLDDALPTANVPLFGLFNGNLYTYNYSTKTLIKFVGESV